MANLSQLRTDLRTRFRDVAGNFISDTPATLYLNIACEDFSNNVEPTWREYGFYVTAKQYAYPLPSDYQHALTMMWYQNGQYEIPYLSPQEFKSRGYMNRRISVSTPQAYTIDNGPSGQQLMLGPAPGSSSNTSLLSGNMTSSQTTVPLVSSGAAQFQSPAGMVLIESEQIIYQNQNGSNQLSLCQRGAGGTTPAAHTFVTASPTVYRLDLVMMYTYQFIYMSAASDSPNFAAQYHRIPINYALSLALIQDGRDKQAAAAMAVYLQERAQAKRQVRILVRDKNNRRISTAYA